MRPTVRTPGWGKRAGARYSRLDELLRHDRRQAHRSEARHSDARRHPSSCFGQDQFGCPAHKPYFELPMIHEVARSASPRQADPSQHIRSFLADFRLLEAAGACELVADDPHSPNSWDSSKWWSALAVTTRAYRAAILNAVQDGYGPISDWADDSAASYFAEETARLSLEHQHWLGAVPGGRAYVAWLSAYVATAELDGRRAVEALRRCAVIAADFLEVSEAPVAPSVYEQLQLSADVLSRFLPLPQHPLRDMRRFALLPETFPN